MKIIGIILFCITLMGCVGLQTASVQPVIQTPEHRNSSSSIVGKVTESRTGEPMIVKEDLYFYDGVIATTSFQPPSALYIYYPQINKGTTFITYGTTDNGDVFYKRSDGIKPNVQGGPVYWDYCIIVNSSGVPYGDGMCNGDYIKTWETKPSPSFLEKSKIYNTGSNRKELIYNGKSKDTIKLAYREYKDDLARPAFYQDLTYDLSESKIIGFRSMNIEVIEATNSSIKFIVKSPME